MRIALSGTEFAEADGIEELITTATYANIDAVEMWYPKNYSKDTVALTTAKLRDAGMSTICISTPTSLYGSKRGESTVLLHEALELAALKGVGLVNTYFGNAPLADDTAAIAAYAEAAYPIVRRAESLGVTLVLENEFDAFGWDPAGSDVTRRPAALAQLCERIDSQAFGLTFDPANFRCASVDASDEALPALAEHIRYVHVKDVVTLLDSESSEPTDDWPRYTDHGNVYKTVRLGYGEVGWVDVITGLAERGYSGFYTLEPHCSKRRLRDETSYARNLVEKLIGSGK